MIKRTFSYLEMHKEETLEALQPIKNKTRVAKRAAAVVNPEAKGRSGIFSL